jgi:hypothetical protein
MGEPSSKIAMVQTQSNIKENIHLKHITNLRHILVKFYFTTVHVHQGRPTWLRPCILLCELLPSSHKREVLVLVFMEQALCEV